MTNDTRSPRRRPAAALTLALLVPSSVLAFSTGPIDGVTGAPGEGTCVQCHNSFPLNSGAGSLVVTGIGDTYTPGQTYAVSVRLADPDAMRWGTELTMLNADGVSVGSYVLPTTLQQSTTGQRTYVKHNATGTFPGQPDSNTWTFDWTAPPTDTGPVTIYVAGNAANNSNTNQGDRIYATSFTYEEFDPQVGVDDLPVARLLGNHPNPFNPRTVITFSLPRARDARLDVYTMDGRRVATLVDGLLDAGAHEVTWDGCDDAGRAQPSGAYAYALRAGGAPQLGRMTLVR